MRHYTCIENPFCLDSTVQRIEWILRDTASVWRRIGFKILLFYLFFFAGFLQFWLSFLCILIIN